jgi:hypothetical protein
MLYRKTGSPVKTWTSIVPSFPPKQFTFVFALRTAFGADCPNTETVNVKDDIKKTNVGKSLQYVFGDFKFIKNNLIILFIIVGFVIIIGFMGTIII